MNWGEQVFSGGLFVAIPIALLAGLVSFASPCVLPLVPGCLAYASGNTAEARPGDRRWIWPESTLRAKLPSTYVVHSPFESLPAPIVLSGWNAQLPVDDAGDERVGAFLEEYWRGQNAPEPGAPCTGALDAPGKVS